MDYELEKMVDEFCREAYLGDFYSQEDKKMTLERLIKPIIKYENKRTLKAHGKLKLASEYEK